MNNSSQAFRELALLSPSPNRMQRWSLLTTEERQAVMDLSAEQTLARRHPVSLWDVFDQLYPVI